MTANQPVLVSIKSNWETIIEPPVIGKDVLELLSSSMYVNPLSIFREYIQNAADSIDEASALGLLSRREAGRVDIRIDPDKRSVRIRDNGTGISKSAFTKTLVALGASRKRGTKARGFRGVGRLAGLGYCQELVFRARFDGEREISEMRWDCRRLKSILRDATFAGNVGDLIRDVVRVHQHVDAKEHPHFFEVELLGLVRHGDDRLMSVSAVRDYLSQVAPVPFSPSFRFAKKIDEVLRDKVSLGSLHIYFQDDDDTLFRPHRDKFQARRGIEDDFQDVQFYEIPGNDGETAAVGWVLDHRYLGAIDGAAAIRGLRLRSGNMQVGESSLLDELFVEPRFNSWAVGEFHVIDDRILPNGRRDHFEQNVHFGNLVSQLRAIAGDVSRRCRVSSLKRNCMRQFEQGMTAVMDRVAILRQGATSKSRRRQVMDEVKERVLKLRKSSSSTHLDAHVQASYRARLNRLDGVLLKLSKSEPAHKSLIRLRAQQRRVIERVFDLIYANCGNPASAKGLIDKVLRHF